MGAAMTSLYRISASNRDLFYRAGRMWPRQGVVVDRAEFSDEDWGRLAGETMLRIDELPGDTAKAEAAEAEAAALRARIRDVLTRLEAEDFGKTGLPKVAAIEKLLPADARSITAALVAEVWADVKAGP